MQWWWRAELTTVWGGSHTSQRRDCLLFSVTLRKVTSFLTSWKFLEVIGLFLFFKLTFIWDILSRFKRKKDLYKYFSIFLRHCIFAKLIRTMWAASCLQREVRPGLPAVPQGNGPGVCGKVLPSAVLQGEGGSPQRDRTDGAASPPKTRPVSRRLRLAARDGHGAGVVSIEGFYRGKLAANPTAVTLWLFKWQIMFM